MTNITLVTAVVTFVASPVMAKFGGYYLPYLLVGGAVTAVAGGLTYTFDIDTSVGKQVGCQILMGAGVGLVVQIPPIIAGVVTSNADRAVGLANVLSECQPPPVIHLVAQPA